MLYPDNNPQNFLIFAKHNRNTIWIFQGNLEKNKLKFFYPIKTNNIYHLE